MLTLKNDDFLRTLGSGLGPFGNKLLNCWIISVCRIHSCK